MKRRLSAAALGRGYYGLQSVAGALWWICVFAIPHVREATLGALDPIVLAAFDVPLFVAASALVGAGRKWAVWIAAPWCGLVALGMGVYATVTGTAGWGAILMIAATAGSLFAALLLLMGRIPSEWLLIGPFALREAEPAGGYLARTLAQLATFWLLFLVAIPAIILWVEGRWRLHVELPCAVRLGGAALLIAASALGIWSALSMSAHGQGTPLPSAMPRRLVIAGPYRFVRNPMAVAGIAQGAAVGILAGSWLVVAYALAGSLVWNCLIRPHEEADLAARFGEEFERYRDRVACWIPRRPGPPAGSTVESQS